MGVVKYFIDETTEIEEEKKTGLNAVELTMVEESLQGEDVREIDITERGEEENGVFDVTFKVKKTRKEAKIINIPTERFIITRNAKSKNDALVVGDIDIVTRGELLSRGFSREEITDIPLAGTRDNSNNSQANTQSNLKQIRDQAEGGHITTSSLSDWALEEVEIQNLYMLVDYDQDGIAERRNIMRGGDVILRNEVFNHVPYAIQSAILMPHKAIGRSRAEITAPTAEAKTALVRGVQDNIYAVNNPRLSINENVVMDDLLVMRPNGLVRNEGKDNPGNNIFPLVIPYIGDKALQVIQYWDQSRAQSTGSLMASQGLDADQLEKETATRFEGVRDMSEAKLELVARNMAETGFRDLFTGLVWLDTNYQDTETEIEVLGEELAVNPADWKFKHSVKANVGLAVGDDEAVITTMTGLYQISQQLAQTGSPLTDQKKLYNILSRIVKASGLEETADYFNDPERPDELLMAENEIYKKLVEQLQMQLQSAANPLADAEKIRAQAKLIEAQARQQTDLAKALEDQRQFNATLMQKIDQSDKDLAMRLTEMEQKYSQQLDAELANNEESTQ